MKKITLILLILSSLYSISQENESCKSKFSIGISASPAFSKHYYYSTNTSMKSYIDSISSNMKIKFSYFVSINSKYRFNKTLGLELSLKLLNSGFNYNADGWDSYSSSNININFTLNEYYIEVPLLLNINFTNKMFIFSINPGFGVDFFIYNRQFGVITFGDGSKKEASSKDKSLNQRIVNLSAILGLGFQQNINKHFSVSLNPYYQQFILDSYVNISNSNSLIWNAGLEAKFYYTF